ncbi:MAG: FAD-dependent monooxygenase [Candidatus Dormibacteraceae bacterium]
MVDILIAGGGPTGLLLACELRLAGANPVVLERLPEVKNQDKANGLTGQVVRLLDQRGLYERCGGGGAPAPAPAFFFGGMTLPLARLGDRNSMYILPIPQPELERVLNERAAELGVDLRRGYEVTGFDQTETSVTVLARSSTGEETTFEARYLVGCDGGHSLVRKDAGFAFPGIVNEHVVVRSAVIGRNDDLSLGPGGRLPGEPLKGLNRPAGYFRTETGVFNMGALDPERPQINTIEWEDHPVGDWPGEGTPMTLVEMEDSVERVLGFRPHLTPPPPGGSDLLRRRCGRNTRLADHYREGRLFIAGDAAHVHAASGGPGLNLALQDAANLGWKLAASLQGWAPEGLLDSYETERRAIGERVFMQTQAQSALYAPGGDVTALRQLFGEFLTHNENVQLIADLMAGTDVRYDMGEADPAPATGWFVPPISLLTEEGERRLAELLHDGRPALLDGSDGPELAAALEPWQGRVRHLPVRGGGATPNLLIRPDGYVAWSGDDAATLSGALHRWFGGGGAFR